MTRISDRIIQKPGKLTDEEYAEIKKHSEYGYKIISSSDGLPQEAAAVALQHHEKSDGSGYPLGLNERQISNITKIVSIADVYDAITSKKVL
ncbi:MAG: HD domain-containing protein [Geovibrio sp.]|nr:HD domain-containing protein [Geovibrio sp.]